MPYYKFFKSDLLYNQIKTHPEVNFFIYDSKIYYNFAPQRAGNFSSDVLHTDPGCVSLYELNVDRPAGSLIYPFITKEGSRDSFRTISTTSFNNDFLFGDTLSGTYPLTASLTRIFITNASSTAYKKIIALKNTLNFYKVLNSYYDYSYYESATTGEGVNLINVPSIFYGSSIKKGSVVLNFYHTGTLIAQCVDKGRNGSLVEVTGSNTGKIAGTVLYNEGVLLLTGSWNLHSGTETFAGVADEPKWIYFAAGANDSLAAGSIASSSFGLKLQGVNYIPTMTMFANARRGRINHSNNPTFIKQGQTKVLSTGSAGYRENDQLEIQNIVSSSYPDPTGSFDKHTYISSVGIYDKNKNLIAIAKLATPVRKREEDDLTFKIKMDF